MTFWTKTSRKHPIRNKTAAMLAVSLLVSQPVMAAQEVVEDLSINARPTYSASIADALVARPLMAAGTVLGAAAFLGTLPFSILGNNVDEAADVLIAKPAEATFRRCLGCTDLQDRTKSERVTRMSAYVPPVTNPDGTPVQIVIQ